MRAEPVCLLLPGMLCSDRLWQAQHQRLRRWAHLEVVALAGSSIEQMVEHILALPYRRFALAGLSLGGIAALATAAAAPERIIGLAVLSATAHPPRAEQRASWAAMAARTQSGDFASITSQTLLPRLVNAHHLRMPSIVDVVLAMADEIGPTTFLAQLSIQASRVDLRPRLAAITCPTMVVAGADDLLAPLQAQRELASLIAGARLEVLQECGHLSPLERPADVSDLLEGWLRGLAQQPDQ